jgi:NADPH:quinone reductase-like Zn-dependent oxidoreductase
MKAWAIQKYGDNSVLEFMDLPEPEVSERDVLIQVKAASINPVDFKLRRGKLKSILPYSFPLILGHDCAGVVVKAGPGVKRIQIGDEVYTRPDQDRIGTLAEFVAAKEEDVARKPKNASFEEAAGLPLVALTSWQALVERAALKRGERVFIPGGSGGVGTVAIQLARHFGAYVITTTSTKNVEFVKSLGANEVIDYKNEDFSRIVSPVDIVFDLAGGRTQKKEFRILKPGGILISIVGPPTSQFMRETKQGLALQLGAFLLSSSVLLRSFWTRTRYQFLFMRPDGLALEKIAELVQAGSIQPVVDRVFSFAKAKEALAYVEQRHARGKVIVSLSPTER